MPTPPKKYPFAIYYNDGSYMTYDLTKADYQNLVDSLQDNRRVVNTDIGVIITTDIRSVVEIKPEKPKKQPKDPVGMPELDPETAAYLREMGLKIE